MHMSRHLPSGTTQRVSLQGVSGPVARHMRQPQRTLSPMRRYEAASLLPDLTISRKTHVAPVNSLFDDATSAFARGTLFATIRGLVAIEDLMPGDYVETTQGPKCILWIGSRIFDPATEDDTRLLRVTANAFGPARPAGDLLAGPSAHVFRKTENLKRLTGKNGVLSPLSDFEDGDRVIAVKPFSQVQLYHIGLETHSVLHADGVEVESFHPGVTSGCDCTPEIREQFLSMFEHVSEFRDFGMMAYPRADRETLARLSAA